MASTTKIRTIPPPARNGRGSRSKNGAKPKVRPAIANRSQWPRAIVLRTKGSRQSATIAVSHQGDLFQSELNIGRQTVWSGASDPIVCVNEAQLRPVSEWEEVCRHEDDDVDYLEIQLELSDQWTLQRQILLARDDRFLYLADAVIGQSQGRIEYRCPWPLCPQIGFDAASETREAFLYGDARLGCVLPLALPEWRTERVDGALAHSSGGFCLQQHYFGCCLYAPFFLDLNRARFNRQLTWRRLTVAEQLKIQPRDVAAGFRVQSGQSQWLIYRALARRGNRTLLGTNLSGEFYVGRFPRSGVAEELLQIE